jgi:hypothetical protein
MKLNEFCRKKTTESLSASSEMIKTMSGIERIIINTVRTTNEKVIAVNRVSKAFLCLRWY